MSKPGYARATARPKFSHSAQNLNKYPIAQHHDSGYFYHPERNEYDQKGSDARLREQKHNAPITPAIAPLAPMLGIIEFGLVNMCKRNPATPQIT